METVECIVVGGGLAGLSAAYGLAEAGMEVMVLERGDYSGAKNVTGGRMYVKPVRGMYPELWDEAPFERPVARELVTMLADGAHTTIEIASDRFLEGKPQSYTVVRAKLDQWLAEKVMEKGAMVVPNMKVDELLRKDGRVIGIRAGGDEIGANVVVAAEGVLRLLSSAAGLTAEPQARHHALGYKEIIELPAGVIEDRWHLNPGEGAAQLFMGDCTRGMMGGAFLYTNKESISLGMVVGMEDMGISQVPRLAGDGYVVAGDTAGLSLNALVTVRGMDFAVASGYYVAEAVKKARAAGDYSAAGLASYEASLRDSFVLRDLETAKSIPSVMENPRLFTHYPQAVGRLLESVYTIDEQPQSGLVKKAWKGARRDFLNLATFKDAWSMRKI